MNTAKTAKTAAKQIAQNEPWEILKEAGRQVAGVEQKQEPEIPQEQIVGTDIERDKIRSQRLMQAFQAELDDIKKKKQQEKVLKLQQEQMVQEQQKNVASPLIEPAAKKGRRLFNFGKKTQMQRQQTQTERPLPPSG